MLTGSINGAAEFLDLSGPGISRLVKHAEESLGIRLFERTGGAFLPAPEARAGFTQTVVSLVRHGPGVAGRT